MCDSSTVAKRTPTGPLPMGATSLGQPKVSARGLPNLFDAGNPADVAAGVAAQQARPAAPASNPSNVGPSLMGGGGGGDGTNELRQMGQGRDPFWSLYET